MSRRAPLGRPKRYRLPTSSCLGRILGGAGPRDVERKAEVSAVVERLGLDPNQYEWFAFYIVVRACPRPTGGPDVDNHIKPVTDALSGLLYPDDDIRHVRAIAVDTRLVSPDQRRTQVWIYAKPSVMK